MTCDLSTVKSKHTGRWPGLFSMVLVFLAELAGVQRGSPKRLDGQDTQRPSENRRKGYPTRGADGNHHTLRHFPWQCNSLTGNARAREGFCGVTCLWGSLCIRLYLNQWLSWGQWCPPIKGRHLSTSGIISDWLNWGGRGFYWHWVGRAHGCD